MSNVLDMDQKPDGYYSLNRERIIGYIPDTVSKLLDVGCGEGNFGALLKSKRNIEVWGMELSPGAAQKASEKLDRVICASIETDSSSLPDDYFDCIVFNDCLEHLVNPWAVLEQLRTKLAPNGYVVASIPNVRFYRNVKRLLLYRDWKYTDHGILDKTHLRFFTKKSIIRLFKDVGFNLVKIEGISYNFRFFIWFLNILLFNFIEDMRFAQFACLAQKTPTKRQGKDSAERATLK